jgi:hypothetical protein
MAKKTGGGSGGGKGAGKPKGKRAPGSSPPKKAGLPPKGQNPRPKRK